MALAQLREKEEGRWDRIGTIGHGSLGGDATVGHSSANLHPAFAKVNVISSNLSRSDLSPFGFDVALYYGVFSIQYIVFDINAGHLLSSAHIGSATTGGCALNLLPPPPSGDSATQLSTMALPPRPEGKCST